jgi:hypothetical protein
LGLLRRTTEAQSALGQLLQLKPDFAFRAAGLMRRLDLLEEHLEMRLDDLQGGAEIGGLAQA